ncbi:M23 family metallopeptidase [Croceiramulus getboli]|nr:M23 family metallopeptidase [Flavobacteriaceae bacterium YJPT1-3]
MKFILSLIISFVLLFTLTTCDREPNYTISSEPEEDQFVEVGGEIIADGCPGGYYPDWSTSEYVLPYPVGKEYNVDLSHCSGSFHSEGEPDQFAIDFSMPIGEVITASRAGTVVFVEESGPDGGFPNNVVVIQHSNNTYAAYAHLTKSGALVEVGQEVEQGDEIGLSGATGLAGYPHLHLVFITGSLEWPYTSFPVTFKNTIPNPRSLASGARYPALPYD